jgi:hypothetical protein
MIIAARTALIAGLVTLLASSGHGQSGHPDWTVYLRRAGALSIGMSIVQVRQELGDPDAFLVQALRQNRELPREPDDSPCAYMVSHRVPDQIGLMFNDGRLVRVDVYGPGIQTASGAQVGDTEARILALYGARIEVRQHHSPPVGAHYMIFTPTDAVGDYQLLFETDGANVTRFRTGTSAAVAQVEGCA